MINVELRYGKNRGYLMTDTITLNPTEYIILVLICYGVGLLSYWLVDKLLDKLNKYFYIKGGK